MIYAKTGDYVVYRQAHSPRRRGVVTHRDYNGVWIRCVAECRNRRWYDRPGGREFKYGHGAVLSVLPPHIAMQYKLKGI